MIFEEFRSFFVQVGPPAHKWTSRRRYWELGDESILWIITTTPVGQLACLKLRNPTYSPRNHRGTIFVAMNPQSDPQETQVQRVAQMLPTAASMAEISAFFSLHSENFSLGRFQYLRLCNICFIFSRTNKILEDFFGK